MVWDLPLRLFHWSMVSVVFVTLITGYLAPEWWLDIHMRAGYALGCLLAFRFVWGFFGTYYSRFNSFPLSIKDSVEYLLSIIRTQPKTFTGHNPLGAWMIVVLLTTLVFLVLTGLVVLGGQENLGPLASAVNFSIGEMFEDIHEILAGILIVLICIHLAGVFIDVRVFRHPVVKAMITGRKPGSADYTEIPGYGVLRGAILISLGIATVLFIGLQSNALPTDSWRAIKLPTVYGSECGDCHDPYHPSLQTKEAWQVIMETLSDHYGEDASLDEQTVAVISEFLQSNDALSFDTEVSHKIGRTESPSYRMTDTDYWKKKHKDIDQTVFKYPSVGSKVNCKGCHMDALTGRFDDAKIKLPKGDKK